MIAPVVFKAGIVIGVIGELATLAIAQVVAPVDRTAVWLAGIGFGGLVVTSIVTIVLQQSAARNVLRAEEVRARREEEREARELIRAEKAQRLLEASKTKTEEIHSLVNSRGEKQDRMIADLTQQIKDLNKDALAKAESSPALGGSALPAPLAPPASVAPVLPIPVKIEGQTDPVEVDVIIKKESAK